MPFVLLLIGLLLFITAWNGTTGLLANQLRSDVFGDNGKNGFLYWSVAVIIIGSIGYIKSLQKLSDAFILLMLIVFIISNKGVFAKFNDALRTISNDARAQTTDSPLPPGRVDVGPITITPNP